MVVDDRRRLATSVISDLLQTDERAIQPEDQLERQRVIDLRQGISKLLVGWDPIQSI